MDKNIISAICIILLLAITTTINAGELHVGAGEAYLTIQSGIDAAVDGDVVIVELGIYVESIFFGDKDIVVRSVDPWDWGVVESTVIDGDGLDHVVVFGGFETAVCRLEGFTVTGGYADYDDGTTIHERGGGILGGLDTANPTDATINRCIIRGNSAVLTGSAIYNVAGTISNCIIQDNHAEISGALAFCSGLIVNCVISGNTIGMGDKFVMHNLSGPIVNCTIVNNLDSACPGYVFGDCSGVIANCILWGNVTGTGTFVNSTEPAYCCIEGYNGGGVNNISSDPMFVNAGIGDYWLIPGSGCIDAGGDGFWGVVVDLDITGGPRVADGDQDGEAIVDIGAYESAASASPVISLNVHDFLFSAFEGGSNPEEQVLTISNSGGGELDWVIEEDCSWLTVSSEWLGTVMVGVDISGLAGGDYSCEIVISDAGAVNSPQIVSVELHVEGPVVEVSQSDFDFYSKEDGASPADQILSISNIGYGVLDWRIEGGSSCSWLEFGPVTGSVVEGISEVVISVNPAGLSVGDHVCELTVFDTDENGSSVVVEVCLHIGEELFVPLQYSTIGSAVAGSKEFDTIIVSPGIYYERIDFGGKNIVLKSTAPEDPGVVAGTVIDGVGGGSVVTFSGSESGGDCGLSGFTVRGGSSLGGGGVLGNYTGAFISHCVVEKNFSTYNGGGIFGFSGDISNCLVRNNLAVGVGGGLAACSGRIVNCVVVGNAALADDAAGGLNNCDGQIVNCTIADNYSYSDVGLKGCDGQISNCIISGENGSRLVLCVEPSYSCYLGGSGNGNIDSVPGFMPDNYRLSKESDCIDAGNNDVDGGLSETDIGGGLRLLDGDGDGEVRVDMGAYEYDMDSVYITVSAMSLEYYATAGMPYWVGQTFLVGTSGEGDLWWEIEGGCEWLEVFPAAGIAGYEPSEVMVVVDSPGFSKSKYSCELILSSPGAVNSPVRITVTLLVRKEGELSVPLFYPTIQFAIDMADTGDVVVVEDGVYSGIGNRDIDFGGKAVTVRSENGPENCIIDCENLGRGFIFQSNEGAGSVVEGITVRHGYGIVAVDNHEPNPGTYDGGGAVFINDSSPSIINCRFVDNNLTATGRYFEKMGGAVFIYDGSPTLIGCVFSGNEAFLGGGVYSSWDSSPVLSNCVFSGNRAAHGGGIYNGSRGSMRVTNCIVVGNFAEQHGGGINSQSLAIISNSIFWDNIDESWIGESAQIYGNDSSFSMRYNCISGWSGELGGVGNIGRYPSFVTGGSWSDPGTAEDRSDDIWIDGDYHLKTEGWRLDEYSGRWTYDEITSPCVDAGNPGMPLGDELVDIGIDPGHEWGRNIRINMGVYGGTAEASMGPVGWAYMGDMTNDHRVDLADVAFFFDRWLWGSCQFPGWCNGADFVRDGKIDFQDYAVIAEDWQRGPVLHVPVAHWAFDENYQDSVGGFDGTGIGEPKFVTGYFARVGSGALLLDGVDDWVGVYGYKGIGGGQSRSVCAWIKTFDTDGEIVSWGASGVPGGRWVFLTQADGFLRLEVGGFIEGSTNVCDGAWHHVAVVLDNDGTPNVNEVRLYVDGEEELPSSVGDVAIDTVLGPDVRIGVWDIWQSRYFGGLIDEVRIYDRALSEVEIGVLAEWGNIE